MRAEAGRGNEMKYWAGRLTRKGPNAGRNVIFVFAALRLRIRCGQVVAFFS
jgi:hypothetical protein